VVRIGEKGIKEKDILVHNAHEPNPGIHYFLANMRYPEYPVALGVIRSVEGETYEAAVAEQIKRVKEKSEIKCVDDLLESGTVFVVE